jgi:GNAT superfamily N-acetyltransferase
MATPTPGSPRETGRVLRSSVPPMRDAELRLADADDPGDVSDVARLLHAFNTEFDTPTPGPAVLRRRLRRLLAGDATYVVLAGRPAVAVAVVTTRPNVWFDGPVALLDELYVEPDHRDHGIGGAVLLRVRAEARRRGAELVEINVDEGDLAARRFYERHGFSGIEPDTGERALYYHGPATPD